LSGVIIAVVSEVARRSTTLGALIVSLPLVSILGILWLWHDTGDAERIVTQAQSTFWYMLPTLPMFLRQCCATESDFGRRSLPVAC
jgi:hypothetical protein